MIHIIGQRNPSGRGAGQQYPVGSIPTTPAEWRAHYGPAWAAFEAARERYDPDGILTPGQGVFPPGP
ncbi:hypothetical protein ACIBO5_40415 [Nonomuraea angiospora]|uniref:hypothetical protein n=1 Tax=Nonomuraea angiospora TaxID=46172 RepID=UPI0037AAA5A5